VFIYIVFFVIMYASAIQTERNGFMNYSKQGVHEKQKALNSKSVKWGRKLIITLIKVVLVSIIGIFILAASAGIGMFKGILASVPNISSNDVAPIGATSFVYDIEGNQIDELVRTNSNRIPVSMDKVPENLAYAFVAIEDERFYEHNGIDFKRTITFWLPIL
ncbi:MAG: transglycosylase domain-containing protein, partial [Aminipila sp.]